MMPASPRAPCGHLEATRRRYKVGFRSLCPDRRSFLPSPFSSLPLDPPQTERWEPQRELDQSAEAILPGPPSSVLKQGWVSEAKGSTKVLMPSPQLL